MSSDNTNPDIDPGKQKEIEERLEAKRKQQQEEEYIKKASQSGRNKTISDKGIELVKQIEDDDKGVIFDKKTYPGISNSEYQRYWDTIGAERSKYLSELARETKIQIPLNSKTSKELDDPDIELTDASNLSDVVLEPHEWRFYDVTAIQWEHIREMDNEIDRARVRSRDLVLNAPAGGLSDDEVAKITKDLLDKDTKRYRYCGKIFFRMTADQLDRVEQTAFRNAVDAAVHRTIASIPKSRGISNEHFT